MAVNYQVFVDMFTQIIAVSFPIALIIALVEKITYLFFDMVFGRNLRL